MNKFELSELANSNINGLVFRHAQDAAFYWKQRSSNSYSPLLNFERLQHFDGLLNAHLNGLRAAGKDGWEIALKNLRRWRTAGECFVASVLMLERSDAERFELIWQIVQSDTEAMLEGLVSALAWCRPQQTQPWLNAWLAQSSEPQLKAVALRVYGLCRSLPNIELMPFFDADEIEVRAAVAELVGRLRWHQYAPQVQALLRDEALQVRSSAALALPFLAINSLTALQRCVQEQNALAQNQRGLRKQLSEEQALKLVRMLGICMPLSDPMSDTILSQLISLPTRQLLTLLAFQGDPNKLPYLISHCANPALARLAGWAISIITGLDLEEHGLAQAAPQEAKPSAQSERLRPISDPDTGLAWPNLAALQVWWQVQQSQLGQSAQAKYIWGGSVSDAAHCLRVLAQGSQAARYAAAQGLALHDRRWPLFEIRAASNMQKEELAELQHEFT